MWLNGWQNMFFFFFFFSFFFACWNWIVISYLMGHHHTHLYSFVCCTPRKWYIFCSIAWLHRAQTCRKWTWPFFSLSLSLLTQCDLHQVFFSLSAFKTIQMQSINFISSNPISHNRIFRLNEFQAFRVLNANKSDSVA